MQPFDTTSETSPRVKLARQIADAVKVWLERGDLVGDGDDRHPLRAGDILILVRQRGPLFEAIIRALKTADIAVAGADRLKLAEHIAIMDLLALADALLHPQDDLALATVLKSPLFGISRTSCSNCARRKRPLRAALRAHEAGAWQAARRARRGIENAAAVHVLCAAARRRRAQGIPGAARPRGQRRARRIPQSRAGLREPADAVAAGLRALDPHRLDRGEARHGDRARRGAGDDGARRQGPGGAGRRAGRHHHGAGRPADPSSASCSRCRRRAPRRIRPDRIAWMPTKQEETATVADARAAMILDNENEYRRLLYVAMTRAADRLIVCGSIGAEEDAGRLLVRPHRAGTRSRPDR